jgi:hypothetical protein
MIGWTIVMAVILLTSVVVVFFKWKQRKVGHIAYWQQQRGFERRRGEAALELPDSLERRQKIDNAKASVERIDGELARLNGSKESVGRHVS